MSRNPTTASIRLQSVTPVPNVYTADIHSLSGVLSNYDEPCAKMKLRRAKVPLLGKSVLATYSVGTPLPVKPHILHHIRPL